MTRKRSQGDCLRAAVAAAYDLPYDDTPASGGGVPMNTILDGGSWEEWAIERDLRWCWSWQVAPIFMDRWIACLDALGSEKPVEGALHAVVMEHDRLLYEPTEGRGPTYQAVLPTDVRRAMWLVPADAPDRFKGRCWAITRPEAKGRGVEGVLRHVPSQVRG